MVFCDHFQVEGTSWSKICRAESWGIASWIQDSDGKLCLVSSITCIHVLLDEISSHPVCYANALYLLELIKLESNLLVLLLVL